MNKLASDNYNNMEVKVTLPTFSTTQICCKLLMKFLSKAWRLHMTGLGLFPN